jgi:hypothetical protein
MTVRLFKHTIRLQSLSKESSGFQKCRKAKHGSIRSDDLARMHPWRLLARLVSQLQQLRKGANNKTCAFSAA